MPTVDDTIKLYRQVADRLDKLDRSQERDRFLLLAADAAFRGGRQDQAEKLRQQLLGQNPNHLLRPHATLAAAMQSPDISAYVQQLRRSFPHEKTETFLKSLPPVPADKAQADGEEEMALPLDAGARKTRAEGKEVADVGKTQPVAPIPFMMPPAEKPTPAGIFKVAEEPKKRKIKLTTPPPAFEGTAFAEEEPEEELQPGAWIGGALFVLLLLASLALFVYVFVAPFVALPGVKP